MAETVRWWLAFLRDSVPRQVAIGVVDATLVVTYSPVGICIFKSVQPRAREVIRAFF